MTAGGKDAAPGSSREVGEGDRPIRTMEEAVAVLEEAGVKYKTHEHRHKHRHEHKHKRSSKDKKHKKDKKHRKSSKKSRKDRHRRRSDSLSSRDSSGRRRRYHRDDVPARHGH